MRHKNRQIEENNNQSNSNFSNSETTLSSSVPPLTDTNYEFLFNQLLEGVAHGWHSKRIVKFFYDLEERGKQEDWVAWLKRFKDKILATPSVSSNQMATIMIRLGELTEFSPQIQQIGKISYEIGRKVVFGDLNDLIWEYDGADFQPNFRFDTNQNSAEISHSEGQSSDFTEQPVVEENFAGSQSITEDLISSLPSDNISGDFLEKIIGDNTELKPSELTRKNIASELNLDNNSNNSQTIDKDRVSLKNQHLNSSIPANHHSDQADLQELITMVQEHEKLVKQISEKLNISSIDNAVLRNSQQKTIR